MKVLILISFALSAAIVQVQAQVADPRVGNRNPLQGTLFTLSEASQVVDSWYDISGFGVVEVSNFPWLYGRQFGWMLVSSGITFISIHPDMGGFTGFPLVLLDFFHLGKGSRSSHSHRFRILAVVSKTLIIQVGLVTAMADSSWLA